MPIVSVIVPCYNEEATIRLLLTALSHQTYPRQDMEVIIADGQSNDGTRHEIEKFLLDCPGLHVKVVENRKRTIPTGLNCAIAAAEGDYIVRLDAHSVPAPDYVALSIEALEKGKGVNVGGVWQIRPAGPGWIARSIAEAAAHPLGVGDARYRFTDRAQAVDTVPFGAFHRSLIERIGGFDESLLTNEDYEFNVRVRQSQGIVWLDPDIRSTYFARSTLSALMTQYWRYGFWKARMLKRYPGSLRWRQALPPLFVLSLIGLALFSPFLSLARILLVVEVLTYSLVLWLVSTVLAVQRKDPALMSGVPAAIALMHISWGAAFLWSVMENILHKPEVRA